MRLWRLRPPVERRLRGAGYDLTSFDWSSTSSSSEAGRGGGDDDTRIAAAVTAHRDDDVAEYISGCEIYWSRESGSGVKSGANSGADSGGSGGGGNASASTSRVVTAGKTVGDKAAEDADDSDGGSGGGASTSVVERKTAAGAQGGGADDNAGCFVGLMGEDDSGTWIDSQNVEGLEILVKDDLRLWRDALWVNDRGFDREGNFVYGNQRGMPYKMRRVVRGGPLEWTMGEGFRTKETFAEKMAAIGVTPGERVGPPVRRPGAAAHGGSGIDGRGEG